MSIQFRVAAITQAEPAGDVTFRLVSTESDGNALSLTLPANAGTLAIPIGQLVDITMALVP